MLLRERDVQGLLLSHHDVQEHSIAQYDDTIDDQEACTMGVLQPDPNDVDGPCVIYIDPNCIALERNHVSTSLADVSRASSTATENHELR
jgi:hypothetical protein